MIADFTLISPAAASAMIFSLSVQSWPRRVKTRTPPLSMTIWQRQPSNLTSVDHSPVAGGFATSVGIIGSMNVSRSPELDRFPMPPTIL